MNGITSRVRNYSLTEKLRGSEGDKVDTLSHTSVHAGGHLKYYYSVQ